MEHLVQLPNLEELSVQRSRVQDAGLLAISRMANLKVLNLADQGGITERGLASLAGMRKLETLIVTGQTGLFMASLKDVPLKTLHLGTPFSRITRDGLATVAAHPTLEELILNDRCPVQSEWLSVLAGSQLKKLNLSGAKIDDTAIPHLAAIPNLEELNIAGTTLSPAGVTELKRLQPACKVFGAPAM